MSKSFKVRKIVRGKTEAEAIVFPGGFSFLGDVDMDTGEIIGENKPNLGDTIAGKVLVYKESKGSSSACVILMTLANKGKAPAAMVTLKPADYNLTEGAILSEIPFVCEPDGDILNDIKSGDTVKVDADGGFIEVVS